MSTELLIESAFYASVATAMAGVSLLMALLVLMVDRKPTGIEAAIVDALAAVALILLRFGVLAMILSAPAMIVVKATQ